MATAEDAPLHARSSREGSSVRAAAPLLQSRFESASAARVGLSVCIGRSPRLAPSPYFFAEEPLPFHWNDQLYDTIDQWRADTDLDANSQFFIGPRPSRARRIRAELDALMRQPTLQPAMFHSLHRLAE
jgi:hypothetical protein